MNQSTKEGLNSEKNFKALLTNAVKSSKEDDIKKHFDFIVKINDQDVKVDVKSIKRDNRYDVLPNETINWVEIKNVNGDTGWLYGEADLIAFETIDYFILVGRLKLRKFIEEKMNYTFDTIDQIVPQHTKEFYKFYQRKDRKDLVVKIKTLDLMHIKYLSIKK